MRERHVTTQKPHVREMHYEAVRAMQYARPYESGVQVGASIKAHGLRSTAVGFNFETRLGYNDGVHAEHSLIADTIKKRHPYGLVDTRFIEEILVTGNVPGPIAPCGSCRDWILSYAKNRNTVIHMTNAQGAYARSTIGELLPDAQTLASTLGQSDTILPFIPELEVEFENKHRVGLDRVMHGILGADSLRTAVLVGEHRYVGRTRSSSAYHGTQALENAIIKATDENKAQITKAFIIDAHGTFVLPFGRERQELFEFAHALGCDIPFYFEHKGTFYRANSTQLLPSGFYLAR